MIFNGKRSIKPAQFYAIIGQIPMPLSTQNELIDEFCRLYFTEEKYLSIKHLNALFERLSDLTSLSVAHTTLIKPRQSDLTFKDTVYRSEEIPIIAHSLILNDFADGCEYIYAYLPYTGNGGVFKPIFTTHLQSYAHKTKLILLADYPDSKEYVVNNLEMLKNMLPYALSDISEGCRFYYSSVSSVINENYTSPFPFFVAFSSCVVFVNIEQNKIMLQSDPAVVKSVRSHCESCMKRYKRLFAVDSDVFKMIREVTVNQGGADSFLALEYEPCIAKHITDELADAVVPRDLPGREQVIGLAYERLNQLRQVKKSIRIFNKDSIMEFARTGIIRELEDYSRPLDPSERLIVLKNLLESSADKNHIFRALDPNAHLLSERVSMYQSNGFLLFSIWNSSRVPHKYCSIHEKAIYDAFGEFLEYMSESNMVYSEQETMELVKEAIRYLEKLEKSGQ